MLRSTLFPYLITLVTLTVIDGVWLTFIAKNWYLSQIEPLLKSSFSFGAAGVFYLIYSLGLWVLIIKPELNQGTLNGVMMKGALFGLCAYAAYDLTNLATLKRWPLSFTVIDMMWGTALSAVVSVLVFLILKRFA